VPRPLTEHWNGTKWAVVPVPNEGNGGAFFNAVSAVSPTDVWAVGDFSNAGGGSLPLIEHWDGHSWSVQNFSVPGSDGTELTGVHAISARDVWAVGSFDGSNGFQTLTLHWNGTAWAQKTSPNPPGGFDIHLSAVTAASSGDVWAVGRFSTSTVREQALILHWDGTAWAQQAIPLAGGTGAGNALTGVAATAAGNAWASGSVFANGTHRTLILRWNGTRWARVTSPNPGGIGDHNFLAGVAALSLTNAWAVGDSSDAAGTQTLILHWNGTAWARVPSPSPGAGANLLLAVAATSAHNVWAVGLLSTGAPPHQTLAVRCC
jgi:hypothetical protein